MFRAHSTRLATVAVLLFGQLVAFTFGSFLVHCQDGHGHHAIEVAHVGSCPSNGSATDNDDLVVAESDGGGCVDVPVGLPVVVTRRNHRVAAPAPVCVVHRAAQPPQNLLPAFTTSSHVASPDSAMSLARNVILLI